VSDLAALEVVMTPDIISGPRRFQPLRLAAVLPKSEALRHIYTLTPERKGHRGRESRKTQLAEILMSEALCNWQGEVCTPQNHFGGGWVKHLNLIMKLVDILKEGTNKSGNELLATFDVDIVKDIGKGAFMRAFRPIISNFPSTWGDRADAEGGWHHRLHGGFMLAYPAKEPEKQRGKFKSDGYHWKWDNKHAGLVWRPQIRRSEQGKKIIAEAAAASAESALAGNFRQPNALPLSASHTSASSSHDTQSVTVTSYGSNTNM